MTAMSAIGTKRTSPSALHMSAFDPKRTLIPTNWRTGRLTYFENGYCRSPDLCCAG